MSKLLLDEQPLLILPELARKIGLNESIVLQQIHYWLEINKKADRNFINGKYWTFNTYEEWAKQFSFWSQRTIRRAITALEKARLIESDNFNKMKVDKTKWYTINYRNVDMLDDFPCGQNGHIDWTSWTVELDKLDASITETYTENISETNTFTFSEENEYPLYSLSELEDEKIQLFRQVYLKKFYEEPRRTKRKFFNNDDLNDLDDYEFISAANKFFDEFKHDESRCTVDYFDEVGSRYK